MARSPELNNESHATPDTSSSPDSQNPVTLSPLEAHRLWARVYDSTPNPLLALESRVLRTVLPEPPRRVIDVACGTGRWLRHLQSRGDSAVGIDASQEMLAEASKHDSLRGCLIQSCAEALPFPESFADLVMCSFGLSYFNSVSQAISEMARISVRGGVVVTSDLHPQAMEAGWTRSFRIGSRVYNLEHSSLSTRDLQSLGESAGLRLAAAVEAYFAETERPIFERASRQDLFMQAQKVPAIWIGLWIRT